MYGELEKTIYVEVLERISGVGLVIFQVQDAADSRYIRETFRLAQKLCNRSTLAQRPLRSADG